MLYIIRYLIFLLILLLTLNTSCTIDLNPNDEKNKEEKEDIIIKIPIELQGIWTANRRWNFPNNYQIEEETFEIDENYIRYRFYYFNSSPLNTFTKNSMYKIIGYSQNENIYYLNVDIISQGSTSPNNGTNEIIFKLSSNMKTLENRGTNYYK